MTSTSFAIRTRRRATIKLAERAVYEVIYKMLAKHEWLKDSTRFVDAIPKNLNGKILKRVLRGHAEKETISKKDGPRL
jgi:acyl-coenzyme A synthetase/AMP-(fatty) acid ligase